jgi:copper chaperone
MGKETGPDWSERKMFRLHTSTFVIVGSQRLQCTGCEQTIQRSLLRLPGVRHVQADHCNQQVIVQFDTAQTDVEAIKAKFAIAGYQVDIQHVPEQRNR